MRFGTFKARLGAGSAKLLGIASGTEEERPSPARPDSTAMAAGVAAKLACSGVFVSGRTLTDVVKADIERLSPLTRVVDYSLDQEAGTVTAIIQGVARTALYRPGVGATLMVDTDMQTLRRQADGLATTPRARGEGVWPAGEAIDPTPLPGVDVAALGRALDAAFAEEAPEGGKDTRAMVVVQDGRIVAERYAPGFDKDTPLLGWSASKSALATLVGALVTDGRLDLDATALAPEWWSPDDPRRSITLDQLLRMSSGLSFSEPYYPGADSTVMLFERGDMAGFAASKPLEAPPGRLWSYSSGTTNLVSRIVMLAVGGTMAAYQRYARERLFEPAGMASAVFEPDPQGVIVGSSYLYATARDWARFGLLYLNGGELGGRRILSRAWVDYVRTPAPSAPLAEYGAHFRLNGFEAAGSSKRVYPNLPHDIYLARGHFRQIVAIVPSRSAVIVRLGWTPDDDGFDMDRHFSEILAALAA